MAKRNLMWLAACLVVAPLLSHPALAGEELPAERMLQHEAVINLEVGHTLPLKYPTGDLRWNSPIAELQIDPERRVAFLIGEQQGEANLLYFDPQKKSFHSVLVRVMTPDTKIALHAVEVHLRKMIDVKPRVATDSIKLTGVVYYPKDKRRLEALEKQFKDTVQVLVTEDYTKCYPLVKRRIAAELARAGLPAIDQIFVDSILQAKGTVPTIKVRDRVQAILADFTKAHGVALSFLVDVDFEKRFRGLVDELGWVGVKVKVGDQLVKVWGKVPSEEVRAKVLAVLKSVLVKGQTLVDDLQIEVPKIIVNLRFVSLGDREGSQLGTDPSRLLSEEAIILDRDLRLRSGEFETPTVIVQTGPLLKLIELWEDQGKAKTLINLDLPVYANEAEPAQFKKTQEVRYQLIGPDQAPTTDFVEAGLIISALGRLERDGQVRLKLDFEVSAFDGVGPSGIPNKMNSSFKNLIFRLRFGQSAMLVDLDRQVETSFQRKVPILSRVPILGSFFLRRRERDHTNDHLFGIVSVLEPQDEDLRKRFEQRAKGKGKMTLPPAKATP